MYWSGEREKRVLSPWPAKVYDHDIPGDESWAVYNTKIDDPRIRVVQRSA